ncbi:MAG: glycosyltransferase family 4 protein [Bacteroidia bacterium]|nr:glycosyltransferase family 4 protein [Bacteroidia bacterium]
MTIVVNTRLLFADFLDGIGRLSYEVLKRLTQVRPNDKFILVYDRKHSKYFDFGANVEHVVIGPPARHPILWKIWFDYIIPKIIKRYQAECFISLDGFNSLSIDIPSIIFGHDIAPLHYPNHMKWSHRWYCRHYFPLFYRKADFIIANSNFTKHDIVTTLEIDPSKIYVAHSGRNDRFKPISLSQQEEIRAMFTDGEPFFVFTGTISPRKNLERLIDAFNLFKSNHSGQYHLMIIGKRGWKYAAIDEAIKQSAFSTHIHILTDVNDVMITKLVASSHAAIYVSLYEGFGLPIIEGMSAHVPVICSDVSSMPEVAGDAAILVDPEDVNDILKAMVSVTTNRILREALIEKGKNQIMKYDWNDQAHTLGQLLDEISKK